MPTPTKAVKANPVSGALIDPPVATFCSANGIAQLSDLTSFFDYKGGQNCSTNPNYPAALKGDVYSVTVAGKIGGASGVVVTVGDTFLATADNAGGTQAAVGSSWIVSQANIDLGNIAITGGTITGTTVSGLTVSSTTGTLTIGNLALVEFQQQVQTIGTFYAGGNVYISDSFTTAGDVIFSGAYNTTFTITANTSVTFPTSGTLLSTAAIGVSVQAYDADLTTWAGITPASGIGTFLATPSSANLRSAVTDETGSGALVFATSPTLVTPVLGTPSSGTLTNCTIPYSGVTGIVHSIYKRNGAAQTLTGGTNVTMSFPTSVKTNAAFNGTTFTAPSSGLAKVTVGFDIYCTSVIGDSEKGDLTLFIRDATAATDAHMILEGIILPFFVIAGDSTFYTAFELSGAFDAVSGHAYQIFCLWDNGGDNAYTQRGFAEWEMK